MFKIPTLCRFCTNNKDLIYDLNDEQSSLIEKLTTLAPETIELNDQIPQKICKNCYDKLNETHRFQQQIIRTFTIYKKFMDYQQQQSMVPSATVKQEPFEYLEEDFISDELRLFLNNLGICAAQMNETFIKSRNDKYSLADVKKQIVKAKQRNAVKRKRGRPRKYCNLEFPTGDLSDVQQIKDVVVNSLPNIDQQPYYEEPRIKRGRKTETTTVITEQMHQVYDVPGGSNTKGKSKKITRIGAIQSDVDPHEYTYQLPYDPKVVITYISNAADKFFFCKSCNKQYCDFSSLRKHFVHHSDIKIFQCSLCDYETFTKHCLDTHQIVHLETRPEICKDCGKTFKSKDRLHRHSYCHIKRFVCDICGKEFSHSAMLKKHVIHIHINERNFICNICGFAAKSQEYLTRHMSRHDDSDANKILCQVCKKLLKTRNSFKIHMKRHEDDRALAAAYWRKAV